MNWYLDVLKKYAVFKGRARRREYWMFVLFNFIIALVLGIIDGMLHTFFLSTIYMLAVIIPSISVGVRRLHDTGRSGWWFWISLVPIIGGIVLLVFFVLDSVEDNEYGPNPKTAPA
jgi:uncharacterized membrane protein YhaH (DUF805 family)